MSPDKTRCIILVLYNSFALVEVFLPFSEALRARGHRCVIMIVGGGKRRGFDDHPFYRDWSALTSEVLDLRREGFARRLLRLISFIVGVRLRHGRPILLHREKSASAGWLDTLFNKLLPLFGRCYAFPSTQAVMTEARARWLIPENDVLMRRLRSESETLDSVGRSVCLTGPHPFRMGDQTHIVFVESERRVYADIVRLENKTVAVGLPRSLRAPSAELTRLIATHADREIERLGLPTDAELLLVAFTNPYDVWFADPDAPRKYLAAILDAAARHFPRATVVVKAKPHDREKVSGFLAEHFGAAIAITDCPLRVLVSRTRMGFVVQSSAVFEFLMAGVPTLSLEGAPESLRPILDWWPDIPFLLHAQNAEEVTALVGQVASGAIPAPDPVQIAASLGHRPELLDDFLRNA